MSMYFCQGGHLDMRITTIMRVMIPFSLVCHSVPGNYVFDQEDRLDMVRLELLMLLVWPIYPILLFKEIVNLIRDSWNRTGEAQGLPYELKSMALLEALESIAQLSIQSRAFDVGFLSERVFVMSAAFSVIGFIKAVVVYVASYNEAELGECQCSRVCQWEYLSSLPKCFSGDTSVVKSINFRKSNLNDVTGKEWSTFLSRFSNLTHISLSSCELVDIKSIADGLEACAISTDLKLQEIKLPRNYLGKVTKSDWARLFSIFTKSDKNRSHFR